METRRSGLLRSFGLCRFVYAGRMPSPILPLSGEGSGILFGSTLIRFQTTFASRSEPRFSSTKIVKAGRKRELVPGFPRCLLSKAMSKIVKDKDRTKFVQVPFAPPCRALYVSVAALPLRASFELCRTVSYFSRKVKCGR